MKKRIAGLLCMVLVLAVILPVFAEETEVADIHWEDYAAQVEESGIDSTWVVLDETGVAVWMPLAMLVPYMEDDAEETAEAAGAAETDETAEETEENEENVIALFAPEDDSAMIEVSLAEADKGVTPDVAYENLLAEWSAYVERVRVNGLEGVYMQDDEEGSALLMLEYGPEQYVLFTFWPTENEAVRDMYSVILASIQKVEIAEKETAAD